MMDENEAIELVELFNNDDLSIIAREIYQTLFDNGEMSLLETKVDDTLLESVHRAIHHMEENNPGNVRDAEQRLNEINDPYLAIAILQKAFLIRKDYIIDSITRQLSRLLYSQNKKTSELTLLALEEAVNSEIPRLQNISSQALFEFEKLPPSKLLAFAKMETLDFQHRIESVNQLIDRGSRLAVYGFTKLLEYFDQRRNSYQYKNCTKDLRSTAKKFKKLSNLDSEDQMEIVHQLFAFADLRNIDDKTKKIAQQAMASLTTTTIQFFNGLNLQEKSNPSVIFTLGSCIYNNPLAIKELIDIGNELIKEYGEEKERSLLWISQQLQRARRGTYLKDLQEFSEAVSTLNLSSSSELIETKENLVNIEKQWKTGEKQETYASIISEIEEDWEAWPKFEDKSDALNVRYHFEREMKKGKIRFLDQSKTRRSILIAAMQETAESYPWTESWKHLKNCFNSLESYEKVIVADVLGNVALSIKSREVETKNFRELKEFFINLSKSSQENFAQKASVWISKLIGEVLPE